MDICIGHKKVGGKNPCFIIAEAGVNHNGDIHLAKKLIENAAQAKVDAIKFQTYKTEQLVTQTAQQAKYQKENLNKDQTQFEMLKKLELSANDFKSLKKYSEKFNLIFLSTPFDNESFILLDQLQIPAFKISSGDLNNHPFLSEISKAKKPIILSTGMANLKEIKESVDFLTEKGVSDLAVLHCTSNYPCPIDEVNLNAMITMKDHLSCVIGYSDHTTGILVPALAVAMGASIIEKHFTLNKDLEGPDHKASLDPEELKEMVDIIRTTEIVKGSFEKKPTKSEIETMKVARKSIIANKNLHEDHMISFEDLVIKRPGYGIPGSMIKNVIGKYTRRSILKDEVLLWEDLK